MGSVVGERFERARRPLHRAQRRPLVCFSASGGARMQEALLSLMQMAKTSAALARLAQAHLPFISVMTDPTTGGVSASLAMLGDLNIAEPRALIGFAGPRVIQQTVRETLPEGFQRSEFLLEHGALDMIVDRRDMRDRHRGAAAAAAEAAGRRRLSARRPARDCPPVRTLAEWLTLQQSVHPRSIDLGLERVTRVAQAGWRCYRAGSAVITVGGTNGKGSIVALLEALARRARRSASACSPRRTCCATTSASASTAPKSRMRR